LDAEVERRKYFQEKKDAHGMRESDWASLKKLDSEPWRIEKTLRQKIEEAAAKSKENEAMTLQERRMAL
jgi:hypothetical protein